MPDYFPGVTDTALLTDEQVTAEIQNYLAEGAEIDAEYTAMGETVEPGYGASVCGGQRWAALLVQARERGLA